MFYSTADAVYYGLAASVEKKLWGIDLGAEFERQCSAALKRKQFNVASWMATQSQFCREALNADRLARHLVTGTE